MIALAAGMLPLLAGMWPRVELAHVRAMHERLAAARLRGRRRRRERQRRGRRGRRGRGGRRGRRGRGRRATEARRARLIDPLSRAAHRRGFGFDDAGFILAQGSPSGRKTPRTRRRAHSARAPS